jgi:GT2 family glycosyltransferase
MHNVAIVILNFNGYSFLKQFLPILVEKTSPVSRIIIADNCSTDQSIEFLSEEYPTIEVIRLSTNYGFAEGYNQALKLINTEYYVLLNSDIEVSDNWLPPLIDQLKHPNVAACQPKIIDYNNKKKFEYAGAAGGFIDSLGYPYCRGRIIDNVEFDEGQYDQNSKIFWATGACLAIRADLFHKVGGFDGDFFAHMEEIDLCWRLQLQGFEITYTYESIVYHIGGGTLAKSNPFKTYLNFRNGLSMIYKNIPAKNLYQNLLKRLILDGLIGINYLVKGQIKDFLAVIKAHFSFYASLNKLNTKRQEIQKNVKQSLELNKKPKSIIWAFIKNAKLKYSDFQ